MVITAIMQGHDENTAPFLNSFFNFRNESGCKIRTLHEIATDKMLKALFVDRSIFMWVRTTPAKIAVIFEYFFSRNLIAAFAHKMRPAIKNAGVSGKLGNEGLHKKSSLSFSSLMPNVEAEPRPSGRWL